MDSNLELDDRIAKDRIKTKRIKKKIFMKKLMGIQDKDDHSQEEVESFQDISEYSEESNSEVDQQSE